MTGGSGSSHSKHAGRSKAGDGIVAPEMVLYAFDILVAHLNGQKRSLSPKFPNDA